AAVLPVAVGGERALLQREADAAAVRRAGAAGAVDDHSGGQRDGEDDAASGAGGVFVVPRAPCGLVARYLRAYRASLGANPCRVFDAVKRARVQGAATM